MRTAFALTALTALTSAQKFPAKGDGDFAGGIFSISLPDLSGVMAKYGMGKFFGTGSESPKENLQANKQKTPGSGPYPAKWTTDPSLPHHTIYAPISPPKGVKLPVIAWGNGACGTDGTGFLNLLTEIASHGYLIIADGGPGGAKSGGEADGGGLFGKLGGGGMQSKVSDMRASIDWALSEKAVKYGEIDTTKVGTAGQSCGGLEAYSTAYKDPRVKLITLFNIGIFQDDKRYLLQEIKAPVGYFLGGKNDIGNDNVSADVARIQRAVRLTLAKFRATRTTSFFQRAFQHSRQL
jgi:dienelactone hydrolase